MQRVALLHRPEHQRNDQRQEMAESGGEIAAQRENRAGGETGNDQHDEQFLRQRARLQQQAGAQPPAEAAEKGRADENARAEAPVAPGFRRQPIGQRREFENDESRQLHRHPGDDAARFDVEDELESGDEHEGGEQRRHRRSRRGAKQDLDLGPTNLVVDAPFRVFARWRLGGGGQRNLGGHSGHSSRDGRRRAGRACHHSGNSSAKPQEYEVVLASFAFSAATAVPRPPAPCRGSSAPSGREGP